jgi:hypothetical protein
MFEGFMANGFAAGGQLTTTTDGTTSSPPIPVVRVDHQLTIVSTS